MLGVHKPLWAYVTAAVIGAVALTALWWWDRRTATPVVAPGDHPAERRRPRTGLLVLGSCVGVLAAAHLMLFAPPSTSKAQCVNQVYLNSAMSYCVNIDSSAFLELSHDPGRVLRPREIRQARPGYIALGAVGARVIGPVFRATGLDRMYGQTDTAYLPLILLNLVVAAMAVLLLAVMLFRLGTAGPAILALCTFLLVNNVVKAFVWTPHQTLFALLVPIGTVFLTQWVIRADPPWWKFALIGLALGAASLIYGSVLITVAVVGVVLLFRGWHGIARAAAFGAAFAALPLAWIMVCREVAGFYYNHEATAYHQFIWPIVEARNGPGALATYVEAITNGSVRSLVSAAGLFLLLITVLVAAAVRGRVDIVPRTSEHRAMVTAAALTVAVSVVFGWAIGYIAERLMFNLVPPLLVLLGWLAARLSGSRPRRLATNALLSVVAVVVLGVTVTAAGPWG